MIEIDARKHLPLGMKPADFLRDYWQKKPLLIRNAFPDFVSPIEPEDLAGLACEEFALSRLITHDRFGHRVDQVELDPSWHWLLRGAVAPEGFDARFSPLWRRYVYRVADRLRLMVYVVTNGARPIRPSPSPQVRLIVGLAYVVAARLLPESGRRVLRAPASAAQRALGAHGMM